MKKEEIKKTARNKSEINVLTGVGGGVQFWLSADQAANTFDKLRYKGDIVGVRVTSWT